MANAALRSDGAAIQKWFSRTLDGGV